MTMTREIFETIFLNSKVSNILCTLRLKLKILNFTSITQFDTQTKKNVTDRVVLSFVKRSLANTHHKVMIYALCAYIDESNILREN